MARALVIKANSFMLDKEIEELRKDVIRQYNDCGVIVVPKNYEVIEVEFDDVRAEGKLIDYNKGVDDVLKILNKHRVPVNSDANYDILHLKERDE